MTEWLLVIILFRPDGDFNITQKLAMPSEAVCHAEETKYNEVTRKELLPTYYHALRAVCLTREALEARP